MCDIWFLCVSVTNGLKRWSICIAFTGIWNLSYIFEVSERIFLSSTFTNIFKEALDCSSSNHVVYICSLLFVISVYHFPFLYAIILFLFDGCGHDYDVFLFAVLNAIKKTQLRYLICKLIAYFLPSGYPFYISLTSLVGVGSAGTFIPSLSEPCNHLSSSLSICPVSVWSNLTDNV